MFLPTTSVGSYSTLHFIYTLLPVVSEQSTSCTFLTSRIAIWPLERSINPVIYEINMSSAAWIVRCSINCIPAFVNSPFSSLGVSCFEKLTLIQALALLFGLPKERRYNQPLPFLSPTGVSWLLCILCTLLQQSLKENMEQHTPLISSVLRGAGCREVQMWPKD